MEIYKNPSEDIDKRIDNLLSLMTLKEKVGQLNQTMFGFKTYNRINGDTYELSEYFFEHVKKFDSVGFIYGIFRADPWSKITFKNGISGRHSAKVYNMAQKYVIENTRLGIPFISAEESPHGHQALDSVLFPTNTAIAATFNPELYAGAAALMAKAVRARGAHCVLVSCLDMLCEPRWGRSEECFSEDPYLAAQMTVAMLKGYQGINWSQLAGNEKTVVILKHFCAQGACRGGHNGGQAIIGERELREIHLPGMRAAVKAGALSCMAAYNEIDGIPCHGSRKLLTDILRGEWGFEGVVMADAGAADRLAMQTGSYTKAAAMALNAGVDVGLWDKSYTLLEQAVEENLADTAQIDQAVRRLLKIKFILGLFENPYADEDEEKIQYAIGSRALCDFSLDIARESIVLLKNKDNILPLKIPGKIAVIGPNADNIYNQMGDYTPPQKRENVITALDGLRNEYGQAVVYEKGCNITGIDESGFEKAVSAAKNADAAVLVMGGSSTREFIIEFDDSNGAALIDSAVISEMECGEGVDKASLSLGGVQEKLIKTVAKTGTPVILVLIEGRPYSLGEIEPYCAAIMTAWYPGPYGGRAIAEIISGKINPSGKLPVSVARSTEQIPVNYNCKIIDAGMSYVDISQFPLYPFGYGLSYSEFEYSSLKAAPQISVQALKSGASLKASVEVKNTGSTAGMETVQLYVRDIESSVTRRIRELKGFKKVCLEPGEIKTVNFELFYDDLAVWDCDMRFTAEPGNIKIFAGSNSAASLEVDSQIIP